MFKIELDNKDFIKMKEHISKVFMDLPIEIHKDGYKIRNISPDQALLITMNVSKDDLKGFEYTNKNNMFVNLPFGEFLDAVKKIKVPLEIGEEGTSKIYIKSDKVTYLLDKQQDTNKDRYTLHDTIVKQYPRKGMTKVVIGRGDFIDAVDQLSFSSSDVVMSISNKKLTFENTKGALAAKYIIDVDVDDKFEWKGIFNSLYMKMIMNLSTYAPDVVFNVKVPEKDEKNSVIVDLNVAPNSSVSLIMSSFQEEIDADVAEEAEDEEEGKEASSDDDFDFEEEDSDDEFDDEDEDI